MGLFYRRPLCVFCTVFILTAVILGYAVNNKFNMTVLIFLMCAALALLILFIVIKRHQAVLMFCLLCACSAILSMLFVELRMNYAEKQAEKYIGTQSVEMSISDVDYHSEYNSAYTVKIEDINGDGTNIKAQLLCAFKTDFNVGDRVAATLELKPISSVALGTTAYQRNAAKDAHLLAVIYETEGVGVKRFDYSIPFWSMIFEENGLSVIISKSRDAICERIDFLLGENTAPLAKGFLLGERSDISNELIRDFRRTGLSHIFAVSGMHVAILLGSLDYVLRRLLVHRYIRMVAVTLLSFPMLAMTGFVLSAWRSVLMLWIAYMCFAMAEETDAPTSLFISITLIILASPYAIFDIGMWLSFFATLGLVTVYPFLGEKIPMPRKGRKRVFLRFLRSSLLVVIMTVVCNTFVLPLQWYIFGEVSLVSVLANVLISTPSTAFMICTLVCVFLGSAPLVGKACVYITETLCVLIRSTVVLLSRFDFAIVSLRYPFASVLVIVFTLAFLLLLVVKLKRKWLICMPTVGFAVAFAVCLLTFNIVKPQSLTYYKDNSQGIIAVSSRDRLALVDLSNGAYFRYAEALDDAFASGATCVDKIVFTKITKSHISAMDYFMRNNIVKEIYIPTPQDNKARDNAMTMALLAENCGVRAYLYDLNNIIELDGIELVAGASNNKDKRNMSVFVASENKLIGYADALVFEDNEYNSLEIIFEKCDILLVGGKAPSEKKYTPSASPHASVVYMSEELYKSSRRKENGYFNKEETAVLIFPLK